MIESEIVPHFWHGWHWLVPAESAVDGCTCILLSLLLCYKRRLYPLRAIILISLIAGVHTRRLRVRPVSQELKQSDEEFAL